VIPQSLLSGDNAAFLDEQYLRWLEDPAAVDPSLRALFDELGRPTTIGAPLPGTGPRVKPRSVFAGGPTAPAAAGAPVDAAAVRRQSRVVLMINAFRVRGHLDARIDPLERRERVAHPELEPTYWGLGEADLDAVVDTTPAYGVPPTAKLRDLLAHLRKAYCDSIGAEFMNVIDTPQRLWVQEQLETLPNRGVLNPVQERRVFRKLCDAENFERMLHGRFPGTKRFSLEGAETLIPLLDGVIGYGARLGAKEVAIGMAHRGRLNVLVNILGKPPALVVGEFQDVKGATQGSGDVKYHLGYSSDQSTLDGHVVHVSLTPNPSHLEAVNAVVEGRVRAKQDRTGDTERSRTIPVLIHGDAAFAGQGSVAEVLNLSELAGYRTGGTIHVVVNNQIGFTTPPHEQRSTPYATDIARMLGVPILHVNGEVPRAVAAAVELAVAWRQRYHRDVVIDMYCYRKHGHNEGDEPSFTQPREYEQIRTKAPARDVYAKHLVKIGTLTPEECDAIYAESFADLTRAADEEVAEPSPDKAGGGGPPNDLRTLWAHTLAGGGGEPDTRVDRARLVELLRAANTLPDGFRPHAKITRLLAQRMKMIAGEERIDWAVGEQAAYATLVDQGFVVRLSGQDSGRGTFSHRHAVVTDVVSGEEVFPLQSVARDGGRFAAIDSSLSELAVLGFEVGYALDTPDGLVLWEAQFGDFVNGAQMIIDQYIVATEQKWHRQCGVVLLLPHGYEGQGPEHSSARLERFLQACAEDNLQVANCTTPANFFHLLRRQVLRNVRKPLVVMTPKSLLRHPEATSTVDELATGRFSAVLPDHEPPAGPVRRVVLCSGRVWTDLVAERRKRQDASVALVRIELLYPFPAEAVAAELARYPGAEVVWCQEEPKNMGAWPSFVQWFADELPAVRVRYVGRPAAASPATGSHKKHVAEQGALLAAAFAP
jgi:2-oxoglutarate dehydrogenase E1 component